MGKHFRVPGRLPAKLEELGVRPSAVLRSAGLPQDLFNRPRILVTTEEFFGLWRGIGENSSDPAIGLCLGTENKPEHFDPIALAALSTGSFNEAIQQIARYKQLSCPQRDHPQNRQRRMEHSLPLAPRPGRRARRPHRSLLRLGTVNRSSGHSDLHIAAASRTRAPTRVCEGPPVPLRLPRYLRSYSQRHRFPRVRCCSPLRNQQRRTPLHARAPAR